MPTPTDKFTPGQHVRYRATGADKTVLRVSAVEPSILCKEGHPPKHGGRTGWFFPDEIEAARDPACGPETTDSKERNADND